MTLVELFKKGNYLTDKGIDHSYLEIYDILFDPFRNKRINVFEVGYFKGGSSKLWEDYFLNAQIRIIDIEGIPFATNRVRFEIKDVKTLTPEYFKYFKPDIAIDDGSHILEEQIHFVKVLYPVLRKNGLLIVEDVNNIDQWKEKFDELRIPYQIIDLRDVKGRSDDVLIIIRK